MTVVGSHMEVLDRLWMFDKIVNRRCSHHIHKQTLSDQVSTATPRYVISG
jgi:hypothetical protein